MKILLICKVHVPSFTSPFILWMLFFSHKQLPTIQYKSQREEEINKEEENIKETNMVVRSHFMGTEDNHGLF